MIRVPLFTWIMKRLIRRVILTASNLLHHVGKHERGDSALVDFRHSVVGLSE